MDTQNLLYLNNAATSYPKPKQVIEAVVCYLKSVPFHASRTGFEIQTEDVITSCRQKLCQLFNAPQPDRMIFTSGSTESLNLAIKGLELNGGHVITTTIEHNSVLRPLFKLEKEGKIRLTIVDCDARGHVDPQKINQAIHPNTKAVVINHSSNVTGTITDIQAISDIAHAHGAVILVDASQSAGCTPIDIKGWDIDLLAFTGHKSLFGLPGIGGLYIKENIKLRPLKVGGTGVRSDLTEQPPESPIYYEAGTLNLPGILALNQGVDFILNTGLKKMEQHKKKPSQHNGRRTL